MDQSEARALTSGESIIEAQAENPVADRLAVAAKYILGLAGKGSARHSVGIKLGGKLVTEMLNDLKDSDMPPVVMEFYIKQLGAMIMWTATGIRDESLPWPEDFQV